VVGDHPFESYSSHRLITSSSSSSSSEHQPDIKFYQLGWQESDSEEEEDDDEGNGESGGEVDREVSVYFEDNRYPELDPVVTVTIPSTPSPTTSGISTPTPQPTTTSGGVTTATTTSRPTTSTDATINNIIINYDDPSLYQPLRIQMDTRQLQKKSTLRPQRYANLVEYIINVAAPKAAEFWSDHLSVIPVEGSLVITEEECPAIFDYGGDDDDDINHNGDDNDNSNGDDDNSSSESSYHTFDNTDLVLYLLIDEGPCRQDDSPPIAFSNDCAMDQFDRPIAGTLLLCSEHFTYVNNNNNNEKKGREQQQKLEEVLQHELAHVLGMSGATMPYWRDASKNGKPRTQRPLVETDVLCINGETQSIVMPSDDTIREGVSKSGVRYFEVVTPVVRNVVANQFDCENEDDDDDDDASIIGARLDQNEYYNCIGSHLSSRIFGTETMVSRNMPWEQKISAVTMALFEDTGWYKANYKSSSGVLHPSSYGYGAGCKFLTDDCIVDDKVPDFGRSTFCNELTEDSSIKCDVSHKRAAKCDLVDYSSYDDDPLYPFAKLPTPPSLEYQRYSDNPGLGAFLRYDADYCPTYSAPPYFKYDEMGIPSGPLYADCSVSDTAPNNAFEFESFGNEESTCFDTIGAIERPLCLSIECIETDGDVSVAVDVGYHGEKVVCEEDGQVIDLQGLRISIECPRREILCPEMFCPANCAGRGICRHGVVNGCECFDPSDTSPLCENSPIRPASPTPAPSTEEIQPFRVSLNPTIASTLGDIRDEILDEIPDDIIEDVLDDTSEDVLDDIKQPTRWPSHHPTKAAIKPVVPTVTDIPSTSSPITVAPTFASTESPTTVGPSRGSTEMVRPPSSVTSFRLPSASERDAALASSATGANQFSWSYLLLSLFLLI